MEDIKSLIPRDKFDMENVEKLKSLETAVLKPILPDLFEWIQDINWPIAPELAKILVSCGRDIVPELKKALASGDDCWQFACIGWIIKDLASEIVLEIVPDLQRIAYHPNSTEKYCEFDVEAKEILRAIVAI
ncbi:DUF5071 domain-containing protein [Brevibacillus choshinensis]|uniref:DUF5071 domain-containing protein n=1 Tax=Brevibacillus choshinensis TaxID=54911 RepID=UPI002E23A3BB|nr:DUF5071 domain-containing protein [Brevibacillus choshinensis]